MSGKPLDRKTRRLLRKQSSQLALVEPESKREVRLIPAKLRHESCYGGEAGSSLYLYEGVMFESGTDGETYVYHSGADKELAAFLVWCGLLSRAEVHQYVDNWNRGPLDEAV